MPKNGLTISISFHNTTNVRRLEPVRRQFNTKELDHETFKESRNLQLLSCSWSLSLSLIILLLSRRHHPKLTHETALYIMAIFFYIL